MKVLFVHENTLGHGSYLPRFAKYFGEHSELGIEAEILNATPLPPELTREADRTVRGLRRLGLDNHFARWREVVSRHARALVDARISEFDAVTVNTQSVGLDLTEIRKPLFVALDATFRELSQGRWFSDPPLGRMGSKLISNLIERETILFASAKRLLPWSENAKTSLVRDYGIKMEKIFQLPPSIEIPPGDSPHSARRSADDIPRALFVGGDFKRKGGDILLRCFRERFQGRMELDVVTNSEIESEEGIRVWRNITVGSEDWASLWKRADLFIFPSRLETFGIVLVEALAFGVPVISSKAGAADEILASGRAGLLLNRVSLDGIASAIENILADQKSAMERAEFGRQRAMESYNLATNSERLARLLR